MLKNYGKYQIFVAITLVSIFLATILFLPSFAQLASVIMVLISIGIAVTLIFQKNWLTYQQAECTREKMIRNLAFDLLGLFLTMGAALYAGGLAGGYVGLRAGFWFGLAAAFLAGFAAAWAVRSVWGRWAALA